MSRVSEVAGADAPDDWPADPTTLRAWIGELTTSAVTASVEQTLRVEAASAAEVAASEASAAGIELAGRPRHPRRRPARVGRRRGGHARRTTPAS